MRIATAFYDRNAVLVEPKKVWRGQHRTRNTLTMDAGYWHFTEMAFANSLERDAAYAKAIELIMAGNGTVFAGASHDPQHEGGDYVFRIQYIIEEADHIPCQKFAARMDRLGVDPGFEYPYDGIAEQGPDFVVPRERTDTMRAHYSGNYDEVFRVPPAIDHDEYTYEFETAGSGQPEYPPAPSRAEPVDQLDDYSA